MKPAVNWPLTAALVWAGTVLGVAVHGYLKPRTHTVFPIYAVAARGWWDAHPDLYRPQPETGEIFRYSPLFAVLLMPLAHLPPGAGNALWKLVNGGAFAVAMWVWLRRGVPEPLSPDQRAAALLLSLPVAVTSLHVGQANLLMVACLLGAVTAAAGGRWWMAAGAATAAVHLKGFPLAFAAVLCVVYWRQFSPRFLLAMVAGLLLPLVAARPGYALAQTAYWFRCLGEGVDQNRDRLKSLDKLLEAIGLPLDRPAFLLLGAVAGAAVLGATLWTAARSADRRRPLTRALLWFLAWAVLFSPSAEAVTFAVLAPALGYGVAVERGASRLLLAASLFLVGPAQTDLVGKAGRELGGRLFAPTVGAVLFAGWLARDLARPARPESGKPSAPNARL